MPITQDSHSIHLTLGEFSSCSIALKGATVYSYKQLSKERLFTSSISPIESDQPGAIRGGIPICFPCFGPPPADNETYNKLKQHGFARTSVWEYLPQESQCQGEQGVLATFKLLPNSEIQKVFPLNFVLIYIVKLLPTGLSLSLKVLNPEMSIGPLPFQALLHSYFRLPEGITPERVQVTPLENLSYLDKVQGGDPKEELIERRKIVTVDGPKGEVDRVYLRAPDKLKLSYKSGGQPGGSSIELRKKNLADVVLWNPGQEKATTIKDLEPLGSLRYVCLEPGQTSSWVSLQPGQIWEGSIQVIFNDNDNDNNDQDN